jgi:O-antigen/teichoic acid export membrane protein
LSSIKKLAGQTIWYGASSIAARFINYLLTPYLTYTLANTSDYGKMGLIYSLIPILNIIFIYGFETAYFRFASNPENKSSIYSTASISIIVSTLIFSTLLWYNQSMMGTVTGLSAFPKIIQYSIIVIAFDALSTIPFARLREEGKPRKFAFIKISSILINIFFTWFFISYCPAELKKYPVSPLKFIYDVNTNPIVYVLLANVIQSAFTYLLLFSEIKKINFQFNFKLWKEMMVYSLPLIIVGMGGMINETFDRLMLRWLIPGDVEFKEQQVGIYNACYKLSILITLFIQAFRMGAEPFFFKQAEGLNPQKTYARVMKFFVLVISVMFLVVSLYMSVWKYFIGPKYWEGLAVVPILLLANMFLGIYYNLSIWYKVSNKTMAGAAITVLGAAITILINYILIPKFGYMACAWATFICYATMMVISFSWGQKVYPIPYAWKKLIAYITIVVLLLFVHQTWINFFPGNFSNLLTATILLTLYLLFIIQIEKKEFSQIPYLSKLIKK